MSKRFFITGIGTGVGKTLAAAILAEAWNADYWKPVQAGDLEGSDSLAVRALISNPVSKIHPEAYRLRTPASPHLAAQADGVAIRVSDIAVPETDNTLIIEGAGGVLVPLNEDELMTDLMLHASAEAILVSRHYLGSINHTLLSAEVLRQKNIPVAGIIFNGEENISSETIILRKTGLACLGRIPLLQETSAEKVKQIAGSFKVI